MRAGQAGVTSPFAARILDHFERVYTHDNYLMAKYAGLIPKNYPTKKDFKEIGAKINYHFSQRDMVAVDAAKQERSNLIAIMKGFQKEFQQCQR